MRLQPRHSTSVGARRTTYAVKNWIRLAPMVIAVILAGCAVGPDYQKPLTPLPSEYLPQAGEKATQMTPDASADIDQWWRILHDRELESLIGRARRSNFDLAIALDRLQEPRTAANAV